MGDALGTAGVGTNEIISSLVAGLGTGGIATCIERAFAVTAVMLRAAEVAGSGSATAKCDDENITGDERLQNEAKKTKKRLATDTAKGGKGKQKKAKISTPSSLVVVQALVDAPPLTTAEAGTTDVAGTPPLATVAVTTPIATPSTTGVAQALVQAPTPVSAVPIFWTSTWLVGKTIEIYSAGAKTWTSAKVLTHDVRAPDPAAKTQSFTVQYAGTNGSTAGVKLNELTYRVATERITAL